MKEKEGESGKETQIKIKEEGTEEDVKPIITTAVATFIHVPMRSNFVPPSSGGRVDSGPLIEWWDEVYLKKESKERLKAQARL